LYRLDCLLPSAYRLLPLNILLATIGSSGDVHPFVGLGMALRRRGHRVTLLTSSYFENLVRGAGLEFHDPNPTFDFLGPLRDARLWHPVYGFGFVMRNAVVPGLRPLYQAITERYVPGETIVVASSLAFAARIAHDRLGVPLVTVHLSPAVFRSLFEGPRLPAGNVGSRVPKPLKRLQYWMADTLADAYLAKPINNMRRELGLAPVRCVIDQWWNSPQRVLGFFPDWYRPPQPDWPSQLRLTGFPLYDERGVTEPSEEVRQFLEAGERPIVFTPGSANVHGHKFFAAAVDACQRLGRRGVLLTRFPEQLPADLPASVRHFDFVPFGWILPRAAAVVHHGGIGSTAQGLVAGIPQLVMPMGFDQFDNAYQLRRLGVGDAVKPAAFRGPAVAATLRTLLDSPTVATRCREAAARFTDIEPLAQACDWIEELVPRRPE
jgi:rhamnosyltransferase subunit B